MPLSETMDRTKPGREAEGEIQRQKEKRTVPVGVCKDLIQGITKVVQIPTGTVKRLKSRSEISLFCTNSGSPGRMVLFDEGSMENPFMSQSNCSGVSFLASAELRGQEK